ncbi:hypothetical protein CK203_051717 [Vitis vinifera]|uniref:Uncharacterized protein n=1 Tax=Vitis vinifera TaxID=29760 RepID=A0A438HGB8_VITVI|nr:hypothetical protein CK203_051717 [Vitis vinifera]
MGRQLALPSEGSNNANMLIACNDLGVKPIFCATRYGQTLKFKFLANKMGLERQSQKIVKLICKGMMAQQFFKFPSPLSVL